jgi:hypothetical protein
MDNYRKGIGKKIKANLLIGIIIIAIALILSWFGVIRL